MSGCLGIPAPVCEFGPTYRFYFRFPYDWDVFNLPPGSKVAGGLEVGLSNRNEDGFYVDFYHKSAMILTDHILTKFGQIHILKLEFCCETGTMKSLLTRLNLPNLEYFDFNRSSRNSGWEFQPHEVIEMRKWLKRHQTLKTFIFRSTFGDGNMADLFKPEDGFALPRLEVLDIQRDPRPNVNPWPLLPPEAKRFAQHIAQSCPVLKQLKMKGLLEDNSLAMLVRVVMMPYLERFEMIRERDPIIESEAERLCEVSRLHIPVKLVVNSKWERSSDERAFKAAMEEWKHNFDTAASPAPSPRASPPPPPAAGAAKPAAGAAKPVAKSASQSKPRASPPAARK
ncbi:hypothetical protein PAPYR_690 [Paratrimastix pyriformis]|uniref:Uncharacterized protein n=1 Tax=Paratrimastix pyriformis TaxID=342808 RepID=A0ABQ8UW39_9EUKA|nr:hypothetical protein PAPYR_690 [Paratrimastix pyriformis]